MHSSRMRTARAMTGRISWGGCAYHACPPFTTHAPPFTTHAPPLPHMPPLHHRCAPLPCTHPFTTHPLRHAHPPPRHACPPGSNHAPPREQPRTPAPLWTECGHTLLKILPCPNFVAGGKKLVLDSGHDNENTMQNLKTCRKLNY